MQMIYTDEADLEDTPPTGAGFMAESGPDGTAGQRHPAVGHQPPAPAGGSRRGTPNPGKSAHRREDRPRRRRQLEPPAYQNSVTSTRGGVHAAWRWTNG